jgi:hypothetical protein
VFNAEPPRSYCFRTRRRTVNWPSASRVGPIPDGNRTQVGDHAPVCRPLFRTALHAQMQK